MIIFCKHPEYEDYALSLATLYSRISRGMHALKCCWSSSKYLAQFWASHAPQPNGIKLFRIVWRDYFRRENHKDWIFSSRVSVVQGKKTANIFCIPELVVCNWIKCRLFNITGRTKKNSTSDSVTAVLSCLLICLACLSCF